MSASPYPDKDGRVILDLARDRLNLQLETLDAIDSKIAVLFGTSTTLVGILAAVLALRPAGFDALSYIFVGVSIVSYGVATGYAWHGYRARKWESGPLLGQVWDDYTKDPPELTDNQIAWAIAGDLRIAYNNNGIKMDAKTEALTAMWPALFVQTVTLVLTLVLVAA